MTTQAIPKWRASLNARLLNDLSRARTLAAIQQVAQQSPLLKIPAIAASLAGLATKGATLATDVGTTAAAEKQLKASVGVRATSRHAFDLELHALKTLVETNATGPSDITGMGFSLLAVAKPSKTAPDAPAALVVTTGRVHGKATVSVQGKGQLGRFVAESSPDPAAVWSTLAGTGKQRKLSGYASGTKLWVRFAQVRFGLQSAWSVPVLVTIP